MKNRQSFFLVVLILCVFSLLPTVASAKDEWLQVRTKNFNLVGNASEKDIRKVATKLEQFRETFQQVFKQSNVNSPIPTNVVVFKNAGAYKPFMPKRADGKPDTGIAGYFQPGDDVNYITLSTEGEDAETFGTIFHEYVHFIVNTHYGKSEVPPWFNEGLAEYYQTFAIEEDQKVKLGLPQSEHLFLLQQTKLIPLDTFFKISNYSLHQNGNHSRSIFYAQAWALIHYLVQGGKAEGLGNFLSLLLKNVPAEQAFRETFQTSYPQMEKELKKYVEQNSYKYSLLTFENKLIFDNEMKVTPLTEAESCAYLGDLLYHTNRVDDAEPYLQKALGINPNLSMANTSLGMVKIRQRKFTDAKNYLQKAISEDQKNHLAFYNYAYLLSREDLDEFGYISEYPSEKTTKMRELLKKAIAINPSFTESYELLAFINLVNKEQLDEAVSYLRKALQYQPGNQRYAIRIAAIYLRQEKFAEAAEIADKIAKTSDKPETKAQAENLADQIRKIQEINARNQASRKQYEEAVAEARKNGSQPTLIRRGSNGNTLSPEEEAKNEDNARMLWINQRLRKAQNNEKQVIGRIQKIECKDKIIYTVKTDAEIFMLTSKDFENLASASFVGDTAGVQIGCEMNIADFNLVLTYKNQADDKSTIRGELIAVEFVPKNFRFMDASESRKETAAINTAEEQLPNQTIKSEDLNLQRRKAIINSIKSALRQPAPGEIREIGFIEKVECGSKGMFFFLKNQVQTFKLAASSPQAIQIRAYTPDIEQIQMGCAMKQVDIPVVFTYKENANLKAKTNGDIISLEFVPKSFVLEK